VEQKQIHSTSSRGIRNSFIRSRRSSLHIANKSNSVSILTGPGRLHLFDAAQALADAGMDVQIISGWAPRPGRRAALDLIGRMVGQRNLSARLGERQKQLQGRALITECVLADFVQAGLGVAAQMKLLDEERASRWGFRFSGRAAKEKLRGSAVVHVRSGAGRGGAIERALDQGSKVITDHSIAHPETIERVLGPEYARYRLECPINGRSRFWRMVLADCEQADRIVVNSDYVKETFVENGFSPERISVVYLGVRSDFLGVKDSYESGKKVKLLYTGHFELRKGARTLLDACQILKQRGVPFVLQVVGSMGSGKVAIMGRDLGDEVEFVPYVLKDVLRRYLAEADIFVFPTFAEGSSRSAMEALGAGLPVVTTKSCGVPIEDGVNGVYVEPGDAETLADRIEELAADTNKRKLLGRAAYATVCRGYTWADYAAGMMQVYRSAGAL
jgi:glycosyltransferase involved in cell wall biosynthesis